MCSIFGLLDFSTGQARARETAYRQSGLMTHRGPDSMGLYGSDGAVLVHNRISIIDVFTGDQPLYDVGKDVALVANAEIYNHMELRRSLCQGYSFATGSDCEVIIPLYKKLGTSFLNHLNGMFAFILYDARRRSYLIARDHVGIMSLYYGRDAAGALYVASEMKALTGVCCFIEEFPIGQYFWSEDGRFTPYYEPAWRTYDSVRWSGTDKDRLRASLEAAVRRQLMSDVPFGVLLSGGVDSSAIAAITCDIQREPGSRIDPIHSFSIGLKDSSDLPRAREVADHIGTTHHEYIYTVEEGLDALRDVIFHIETYDVTTVRASTPMFLLARKIRAMGIKMVLTGEGSDEVFGGYLYFHRAPNAREFHDELIRKIFALHSYDCLRANKSMLAWGVEPRVPYLDREFLDVAMRINPDDKLCGNGRIEKQVLRESVACYLPKSVIWRQKEQFSDGVGYSWIDSLKAVAEERVSDGQMAAAQYRFAYNTPASKESYLYRAIFDELFPGPFAAKCVPAGKTIACSTEHALRWEGCRNEVPDPSGRAMSGIHLSALLQKAPDGPTAEVAE